MTPSPELDQAPSRIRMALPLAVAVALVMSAALLVLGTTLERSATGSPSTATVGGPVAGHSEAGERGAEAGQDPDGGREGSVIGIPIDSPVPIGAAVLVSIGLAALVWRRPTRPVTTAVVVVALAAAAIDVAEISHQLGAGNSGLAALAMLVAALHLAVIAGACWLWRTAGA